MSAWNEFPSLHPMVVHFPIALLVFAALFQAVSLFWSDTGWQRSAATLLFGGLVGTILASWVFHPEPFSISGEARQTFENHKNYADYTLYLVITSSVAVTVRLVWRATGRWIAWVACILMLAASVMVCITGHLGAQLTHIHKIEAE